MATIDQFTAAECVCVCVLCKFMITIYQSKIIDIYNCVGKTGNSSIDCGQETIA